VNFYQSFIKYKNNIQHNKAQKKGERCNRLFLFIPIREIITTMYVIKEKYSYSIKKDLHQLEVHALSLS